MAPLHRTAATWLAVSAASVHFAIAQESHRVFVDQRAQGLQDGNSWTNAFVDLQDALAVAKSGDEVWIARGTYKPDRGTKDRAARFSAPGGIRLRGGFAGSETSLGQRSIQANETILSGDLDGDDGPLDCEQYSDCCVEHAERTCDNAACLAAVCEAAPNCCDPSFGDRPWDRGCVNTAKRVCCFIGSGHRCENSYGVLVLEGDAEETMLDRITVERAYPDEWALYNLPDGLGGVWVAGGTTKIIDCTIRDNITDGVIAFDALSLLVERSRFLDNTWYGLVSSPASDGGSSLVVRNSHFENNGTAVYALAPSGGAPVAISDCTFLRNKDDAIFVWYGAKIERCWFEDNGRRGVHYSSGQTTVTNSVFLNNGGGLSGVAPLVASNCVFLGCEIDAIDSGGSANVKNCIFAGNPRAGLRAGGPFSVRNCSFFGNGPAVYVNTLDPAIGRINNSVFWGNRINHPHYTIEDGSIFLLDDTVLEINHSIVEGWTGQYGGVGNSGVDPLFVDPDGPDDLPGTLDDDLRLLPDSPAINAGDPTGAFLLPTDLDGHPRVLCGRVDMGAYEFGFGDYDCDRSISLTDLAEWPFCASSPGYDIYVRLACVAFDSDGDVDVDLRDFAAWQRLRRE